MSRKNLNGVHIPHRKNTAGMQAIKMPPPATVTIPMSMHIGKPANCIVAVGDHVNVGQMIGEPGGFVSCCGLICSFRGICERFRHGQEDRPHAAVYGCDLPGGRDRV